MKIVKESINFERGKDPKKSMDIGVTNIYGEGYDLFITLYEISKNSDNFGWVSEILWKKNKDYKSSMFQIESKFYYTTHTREGYIKNPEWYDVYLTKGEGVSVHSWDGHLINMGTKNSPDTIRKFSEATRCFEE